MAREMDDQLCRKALIRCQIDGKLDSIQGLADAGHQPQHRKSVLLGPAGLAGC
jgi:hypothetical protein